MVGADAEQVQLGRRVPYGLRVGRELVKRPNAWLMPQSLNAFAAVEKAGVPLIKM